MEVEKPPESVEEAGALLGATITVYGVADSYKLNKPPQGTHSSFSTITPVPSSELFGRLHTLRSLLRSVPTDKPLVAAPSLLAGVLMKLLGVSNKLANNPPNPKNKRRVAIPPMLSTPIRKVWVDCVVLCHSLGEGLSGNARINTFGFVRNMIQLASLNPRTAKAAGGIRIAALEAIEGIMKDPKLSIQLASWAFDVTRVCQKAIKSSGNGEPTFRVTAINTAMSVVIASRNAFMKTRPVEGSARLVLRGALDDKAIMEMVKLIKTAVTDKFPEIRTAAAHLAALLAPQVIHTAIKSPRTPDAAASFTTSLEDIMTIAFKNLDDTSAECAAAWGEALARCMSTAIEVGTQQSAEQTSQRDAEDPQPSPRNNRQRGKKNTNRKGILAAENCSTLPKTLKYLVSVFVKAGGELVAAKTGGSFSTGGRAVRLGFTRAIIQLLRLQSEIKAIGDGKSMSHKEAILIILSMVGNDMEAQLKGSEKGLGSIDTLDATSVVTASTIREPPLSGRSVGQSQGNALFGQQPKVSHADAPIVRLCTSRVLREGILDFSPETTQIAILHEFIDLCVNRQAELKGNQLQVVLTEISHLYARLGEASQSSLEDFTPALKKCLRHADHGVRHEAAVVCGAITSAFPAVGRKFVEDGIREIQMEHAELMAAASAGFAESAAENSGGRRFGFGRRNTPNKKEKKPDTSLKHQFAIHGISLMLTIILRDLPSLPGGLSIEVVDDVMSSTEVLCSAYDNDVLINGSPSGVCTCVRAGFAMICGVLATGPDTISKHIERIFGTWQKFSKLPAKGNKFTSDHELLCVEAMLSSILSFLRNCSSLLLSIPDALSQASMALERLLPRFHNSDGNLRKVPGNPAAALRVDTAKACIMEAFSWLPQGSYPMVADALFAFSARHIQISVDHDASCSILQSLISYEDKILDTTTFCRATHQGQVGGLEYLDEDITARASEASHHTDRESALLFYSTSGSQKSNADFLGSQVLGMVVSKGIEEKPPTELHAVGSWHMPATPSCSSKVRLVDAAIQAFAATFTLKSPKEQQRAMKMLESLVPPMHFQATRGAANDHQSRRGKGKDHSATFTNVTAVILSCLKALPVHESTHNVAVGIGPTWMSQAKDVLLNILPCQSPFVRRGAAEGLAILSTLGVKEDAHFLQSAVIHSLDEVFKGSYTAGQANQMPPESISAASATALLTLGCIQRTSNHIHEIRVEQSKMRGSPKKAKKEEDEILPTLQMMARVLPSTNCGLRGGFFRVRAHALHTFGLLLSYSNKLIGISLGEEEIQLLKKLVFVIEDNFLASWTIVTSEKDHGIEAEKLAAEPCFLAILLRLMTFLMPSLHHLTSVDPTVSLRFSQIAATIVAIAGAHPTVAMEASAFYEVSAKSQHIFPAYLSGIKYSEHPVLCSIPFLMQQLVPSRSLVEPDYAMIQPSCASLSPDVFAATQVVIKELTISQVLVTELSDLSIVSILFAALESVTASRSFRGETKHRGIAAPREIESVYVSESSVELEMLDLLRLLVYVEGRTSENCEATFLRILLLSRVLLLGASGSDDNEEEDNESPLTPKKVANEALQRAVSDATVALDTASPMRWQVKCMVVQMAIMALEALAARAANSKMESPILNPETAKQQCLEECRKSANDPTMFPESKLALHIDKLVSMACVTATCTVDQTELRILQACAIPFLSRILLCFGSIPDPDQPDTNVLHEHIPQISSCIKSALGAVDEDEGAPACRLFMAACESLESFLESEITGDVAVLKRIIRPALPVSDEVPFFGHDERMPLISSGGAKVKSVDSRAILLTRIGKLGIVGTIPTEDSQLGQMIEADAEGLGAHAAAMAIDGARLLLGSQCTLAGGRRAEDGTNTSTSFYCFEHADEIDDVVKAALVQKWAAFASNAMGQLSESIASESEKTNECIGWLQKIVPLIFTGTRDAITANKCTTQQRSSLNWIRGMDVETVLCNCLQAINMLVSKPAILLIDEQWKTNAETILSEISKEILLPGLSDKSSDLHDSNKRIVAASCALLESLAKNSALKLSSDSPLLLSLMLPLDLLQKGVISVAETQTSLVVSACMTVVGSVISKSTTPISLVKGMLQFVVTSSRINAPANVILSTHFLLRECMKHQSISIQDQSTLASKMLEQRDFDGWAVIVQATDGLAAAASFVLMQQLLLGSSHQNQIDATTTICELVQSADAPSPVIGRVTAAIGVEILAVLQMYGTLTIQKEFHVHRTNICASCIKFLLAAIQQFTSDSLANEDFSKFLVVMFMAIIPVVRYNGLPNHPLPNGLLSDPAIGRMCAQTMVHIARTAPVPFKTSMGLMTEQDRAVLEFAVRADMSGYAVAAKAPVKKKLNLKGFKK